MNQPNIVRITQATYADMSENYGGYCSACGDEAYGVEPDASRYRCESCGELAVYGVEELLISGLLQFLDEEFED